MILPLVLFILLWSAFIVATPRQGALHRAPGRSPVPALPLRARAQQRAATGLHDAALLVAELAALLRAGRSAEQMWRHAALSARRRLRHDVEGSVRWPESSSTTRWNRQRTLAPQRLLGRPAHGNDAGRAPSAEILVAVFVLEAAAHAAALGAPVGAAIREALSLASRDGLPTADPASGQTEGRRRRTLPGRGTLAIWSDVAACVEAAETSGCPLAAVFDRLSAHLESDADAAAARATALAGPKATTRILTVLPFVGLVLGTLVGAKPLEALTTTFLGFVCLISGGVLALAGRLWSSRLVAQTGALR